MAVALRYGEFDNGDDERKMDWTLFLITILLLSFGIVMVFDASYSHAFLIHDDSAYWVKRQLIWAGIGLAGMYAATRIGFWKWRGWAVTLMVTSLLMLVAVRLVGHEAMGGQRWIGIGAFKFQPSEFAKLALVIYSAHVLANRPRIVRNLWSGVLTFLIVPMTAILLVERQPDLGTAATMLLTLFTTLYAAGARARWLAALLAAFVLVAVSFTVLHSQHKGFRWNRITAFINPEADPLGAGFQITHSLAALGTGGVFGVGFGESREKLLGNLPMQRTDFIYAIIGEELGLVGSLLVLFAFGLLTARGCQIAYRTKDPFGKLLAVGLTAMTAVQALLNVAVVTGSLPTTGIPLPFISYGGSSLVLTLFSIGMLLNISQHPDYEDARPAARREREHNSWSPDKHHVSHGSAAKAKERLMGLTHS